MMLVAFWIDGQWSKMKRLKKKKHSIKWSSIEYPANGIGLKYEINIKIHLPKNIMVIHGFLWKTKKGRSNIEKTCET